MQTATETKQAKPKPDKIEALLIKWFKASPRERIALQDYRSKKFTDAEVRKFRTLVLRKAAESGDDFQGLTTKNLNIILDNGFVSRQELVDFINSGNYADWLTNSIATELTNWLGFVVHEHNKEPKVDERYLADTAKYLAKFGYKIVKI